MLKKVIISIVLIFLLEGCGYQPLFSGPGSNFEIENISLEGDIKIAKKISRNLVSLIKSNDEDVKKINITINVYKDTQSITKDTTGKTTNFEITLKINIIAKNLSNDNVIFQKEYLFSKIYQSKNSASDTLNVELKAIDDIIITVSRNINIDIQTSNES